MDLGVYSWLRLIFFLAKILKKYECMLFLGFPLWEDLQAEWGHGESRNNYKLMLHVIAIAWWLTKDIYFDVDVVFYCNHIVHWNHASDPGVQCSWNHQRCKPSHQWTQVSTYFLACIFISYAWNKFSSSCPRLIGQRYQYQYGESIPCEQLVSWLCDIKQVLISVKNVKKHSNCCFPQAYTQSGGKRPFGVSILYMGWDKHFGYQLVMSCPVYPWITINFCVSVPIQVCSFLIFAFQYQSDPSGNYGGWKATCIGNNWNAAVSMLKQEYKVGLVHKIMRRAWMVNTICLYSLVYRI